MGRGLAVFIESEGALEGEEIQAREAE